MMFFISLICFILLPSINPQLQINLHLTDWTNYHEINVDLQHDCIHVPNHANEGKDNIEYHQITSYCMGEWPSEWHIEENSFDQKYSFSQLKMLNITSQQLYLWSAPMDIVEEYESYLNQSLLSNQSSALMATKLFYNCTQPRFGSVCQYSLDISTSSFPSSLKEIIHDFYLQIYNPTTWTCYTHLECNRGTSTACLDWTEICDDHIDCLNDGIDEKYCWELEINECEENEFRCKNGQCIPNIFFRESSKSFDCIDQSDELELLINGIHYHSQEPIIRIEDISCNKNINPNLNIYFTTSCVRSRSGLILEDMFLNKPNSTSDECWFTFRCYFRIPHALDPICNSICINRTCQEITNETCPDILFIPNAPLLFGHIYFAYTKEAAVQTRFPTLPPPYICYNDQLCGGFYTNRTLLPFNNLTCRRPGDFPVTFSVLGRGNWLNAYVRPLYRQLYKCNTIIQNISAVCDNSIMYRCINSSKCISKDRIDDDFIDCDYGDDEDPSVVYDICLKNESKTLFKCTTTRCIHHGKVNDGLCHCGNNEYGLCDDEDEECQAVGTHLSFPTVCDGFINLFPVNIDGRNETDETECERWQCNNTYTRCDGFWNCFNGADEAHCDTSVSLNCPSDHHMCISPITNQLTCLPLAKANDGIIDCLGATDEPKLCRSTGYTPSANKFYCFNNSSPCEISAALCNGSKNCINKHDDNQHSCSLTQNFSIDFSICNAEDADSRSDVQNFFCEHVNLQQTRKPVRFSLDAAEFNKDKNAIADGQYGIEAICKLMLVHHNRQVVHYPLDTIKFNKDINTIRSVPPDMKSIVYHEQYRCHRGLPLRIWLNQEKNLTNITCLCPPSFYGNICQYQNQRVSLTMRFQAYSDSRRTLFALVITLIDDSDKRIIHSYEQLTYLYFRDCQKKFSVYLLYSTRPKNVTQNYSIHIDIYDKTSLTYRGSLLTPIKFPFLPVHRIAVHLNIPRINDDFQSCTNQTCIHGQCTIYPEDSKGTAFCHCNKGWSGQHCNIPYTCKCSSDSLCAGLLANNRSLCVCPINKFGPRCLFNHTVCQSNQNNTCYNGGKCIPIDEYMQRDDRKFFCMCPKGFTGERCEIPDNKMILSFHKQIQLSQTLIIHFIKINNDSSPTNSSTLSRIPVHQKTAIINWTNEFHIAFAQLSDKDFYLITVQKINNLSSIFEKTINPSDRCEHISKVLKETIVRLHPIRRIKYYHVPCNETSSLPCFFDDVYFCLCTDFNHQRIANCFEFNYTKKHDCFGESSCKNGAQCVQDSPECPQTSMCVCPQCYYGTQCQFKSTAFRLSLDAILGYHILPHIRLIQQPTIVQFSLALTIIMTIAGFIDGILSVMTFKDQELRSIGCGVYLLGSAITTLFTMSMFALKFSILIVTQMSYTTNRSFLNFQCISIDFLVRISLYMDQWLNACVAIDRAITAVKGTSFNKKRSKRLARYVILALIVFIISTTIYDPFYRDLLYENNNDDDDSEKRIWCIASYSSGVQVYDSFVNIFHFIAPFFINLISAIIIIRTTIVLQVNINRHESYRKILLAQLRHHGHLLYGSVFLVILAIPRIIISLLSNCMETINDPWIYIIGYFISFIPSTLTFILFILPSKNYKGVFRKTIQQYLTTIKRHLHIA
ncbi:unnamed protein product [Adineta steineri]|uniref:Uncharacterized protein n=1 Tax=Adineta steineri TaxID=433720 RepID=A0A814RAQ0_9BILA|nr:unnamed protein product [Adineta steineri]CAF4082099.1 unnamed protein product [Adineta steineri]